MATLPVLCRATLLAAMALAPLTHAAAATAAPAAASTPSATDPERLAPYAVVQDSWIYLIDEPGIYLQRAQEELARKQPIAAASNVRKAAAMVSAEARRSPWGDRNALDRDAQALLAVARDIDTGKLRDPKRLDADFAASRTDLGLHHDLMAAEAWLRKDTQAAGRSLAAAARYVRSALSSADQGASRRMSEGLLSTERFGERLGTGAEHAVESDWKRARDAVGEALVALGKNVETR